MGQFEYVKVTPGSKAFSDAEAINQEAFPPNDRKSMDELVGAEKIFPGSKVIAVYEEGQCVSFFHLIENDTFVYGAFFAVSASLRGKGYGTRILKAMLEQCGDKPFIGEVEYPSEDAQNYEQRVARIRFYERNGVYNTEEVVESGNHDKFFVISSVKDAPLQDYKEFNSNLREVMERVGRG